MAQQARARDAEIIPLHPSDPDAAAYVERSLASSPLWQMAPKAPADQVSRRDPRVLDFLASARNAPLGEMEFDVLAWTITRWYQLGRPTNGRINATFGDLARSLYGKKGGGKQYVLIRDALDHLYNVSLDLVMIEQQQDDELWRRMRRKRIFQMLELRERVGPGEETAESGIQIELASWLVAQLDTQTITALAWQVLRRLSGVGKRLAIYLAAQSHAFEPITAHTERFVVALTDDFYEELGISSARDRDKRASVARAAEKVTEHDPRYSRLVIESQDGSYVLRAERPIGAEVLPLPSPTALRR